MAPSHRRSAAQEFVEKKLYGLQRRLETESTAGVAVGEIAALAQGAGQSMAKAGRQSGTSIFAALSGGETHRKALHSREPDTMERAIFLALTTYGSHQQGARTSVHQRGYPLWKTMANLRSATNSDRVAEIMLGITAAGTESVLAARLRGLASYLQRENIPMDYVNLTRDIELLLTPAKSHWVKTKWAEAYPSAATDTEQEPSSTEGHSDD